MRKDTLAPRDLQKMVLSKLQTLFLSPAPAEQFSNGFYMDVAYTIALLGAKQQSWLWSQRNNCSNSQLGALIFALGSQKEFQPDNKWLKPYLNHSNNFVLCKTIAALADRKDSHYADQITNLLDHKDSHVHGNALRYFARTQPDARETYDLLIAALRHPQSTVREFAVDELGELGNKDALPHLQKLLDDVPPYVQQAAQTAIEMLQE